MNYQATIDYLYEQLPMFHRIGAVAYKADLNNTLALMNFLNHPEKKFKSVHIAGTNGKGSCSHTLAAILQSAGYKTGLYTSPHLKDFRERMKINGEMVDECFVIDFVERTKTFIEEIKPSFFEITVGMCFEYFAQQKIDIAIIETGLGGRLDSTNVIMPEVSLITNISLDHTNLLGDTIEKIATEKAGIIKEKIPVVIGEESGVENIFLQKIAETHSSIVFADNAWEVENIESANGFLKYELFNSTEKFKIENQLNGIYQIKNSKAILSTCKILKQNGWNITDEAVLEGFRKNKSMTGLRGRWDILQTQPLVVADIAHNEAGISEVINQLNQLKFNKLHIVLGMVKDKAIEKVLSLLPVAANYYFTQPDLPRALSVLDLQESAKPFNLEGSCFEKVNEALITAKKNASVDDLILITGSNFVVAEII